MIKFLLQHALVLHRKDDSQVQVVSFSRPSDRAGNLSSEGLLERSRITEEIIRGAQAAPGNFWPMT